MDLHLVGDVRSPPIFLDVSIIDFHPDYAGWADKIGGEMFPEDGDGTYKLIRYEPLGVCAGIAAWNAFLFLLYLKVAPAVAAGNTVSVKMCPP